MTNNNIFNGEQWTGNSEQRSGNSEQGSGNSEWWTV